jgi:hypothetical protein
MLERNQNNQTRATAGDSLARERMKGVRPEASIREIEKRGWGSDALPLRKASIGVFYVQGNVP